MRNVSLQWKLRFKVRQIYEGQIANLECRQIAVSEHVFAIGYVRWRTLDPSSFAISHAEAFRNVNSILP